MAQSTGAVGKSTFSISVSLDGTTWVDVSGSSSTVEISGGDQLTGNQFTADGDVAVVVGAGKSEPLTATVSILYTENPSPDAFAIVWARFISTTKTIYFRYAPRGSTSANKRYVASSALNAPFPCPIVSCLPPAMDASSGDVALTEFSVIFPKLFQEVIP